MEDLAPGYILQKMYFKKRLKLRKADGFFYEMGSGTGSLSRILLDQGFSGHGFDLNPSSCQKNSRKNQAFIEAGRYRVSQENFIETTFAKKADMVLSSMVIEHLEENQIEIFFQKCKEILNPDGMMILFVPASLKHWGVEDEIAGHLRRYSFDFFYKIAPQMGWKVRHLAGLTFPLSNFLLPLSNYLVNKTESHKKTLSRLEQTVLSSDRDVKFKTSFPRFFQLFINEFTLYPFYVLQNIFHDHPDSLVIYAELEK